jgi:uncharacterized protein
MKALVNRPGSSVLINIVMALAIIGALNWGLIGFFNWNLVDAIFGGSAHTLTSGVSRFIYAVVGLAGLALLFLAPWQRVRAEQGRTVGAGRRVEV